MIRQIDNIERQYLRLLDEVLKDGEKRGNRTDINTRSVFARSLRADLSHSFPLLTTKRVHWKSIVVELLWFISGETNIKYLQDNKVRIWDAWADENGNLGPVYGQQWRRWLAADGQEIDQLENVIHEIKHNPTSRRLLVNAWNVGVVDQMALPPCHMMFQFYISKDNRLSCHLYMRSADLFLGVPFNIASYSLLTYLIAQQCNLKPGEFILTMGDAHIYENHVEAVETQLSRTPLEFPTLVLPDAPASIDDYEAETLISSLENYQHLGLIKAPIAV